MTLRTTKNLNQLLVTSLVFAMACLFVQHGAFSQGEYPSSYAGHMQGEQMRQAMMQQRMQGSPSGQIQPIFYGNDVGSGGNPPPVPSYNPQQYSPHAVFNQNGQSSKDDFRLKKGYTAIPGAFFRLEYISWDIRKPGTSFLGEQRSDGAALENQVILNNFPLIPGNVTSTAHITLDKSPGARATLGIPLINFGAFEMSAFVIGQSSDTHFFAAGASLPATTYLLNGAPSTFAFGYDRGATVTFSSRMWGADAILIKQEGPPGEGFKFQPFGGLNYIAIREKLTKDGAYFSGVNVAHAVVQSDSINHTLGIMGGVRAELVHRWFTIGVQPKVTLGAAVYRNRVNSQALLAITDPAVSSSVEGLNFTPVVQLGAYLRIHPTENITISGGYDYLATVNIVRPHDSIRYNNVGGVGRATAEARSSVFEAQGFNFSIEWFYR